MVARGWYGAERGGGACGTGGAVPGSVFAVVVEPGGRRVVEESSVPLRVPGGPVDLRLRPRGGAFVPVRPLVGLSIARRLSGGVGVGGSGVRVTMVGASRSVSRLSGNSVFFSDVGRDVDGVVTPTVRGVDLSAVLRSVRSAEVLWYRVRVPAGDRLVSVAGGGARVVSDGHTVVNVLPPSARDAQSSPVPVTMTVVGDELVVRVEHRGADLAYPIIVDPQLQAPLSMPGWVFSNFGTPFQAGAPGSFVALPEPYSPSLPGQGEWVWDAGQNTGTSGGTPLISSITFGDMTASSNIPDFLVWLGANDASPSTNTFHMIWSSYWGSVPSSVTRSTGNYGPGIGIELKAGWYNNGFGQYENYGGSFSVGSILVTFADGSSQNVLAGLGVGQEGRSNPGAPYDPGCIGGDPVKCATGNFFETQTDTSAPYRGSDLSVARTYNSQDAASQSSAGPFGYGWGSVLSDRLVVNQAASSATVTQANGSTIAFAMNSNGTFSAPSTLVQATLVKRADGSYLYTLPDRSSITFDSSGRFVSEADRNGNQVTATRNGAGEVTALTDGGGRSISLAYNTEGTVSSVTDPAGNAVSYQYDGSGNLTQVTDLRGGVWTFGYDASHQLTSMTNPRGGVTTNTYDSSNRVTAQTDPMNRRWTWSYTTASSGLPETIVTDPNGNQANETFNEADEPVQIVDAAGTSVATTRSFTYNTDGLVTKMVDGRGKTTTYTYDAAGNRTGVTDPNGHTTSWSYDTNRDLTSTTSPMGRATTIVYDANGNPTSVSRTLTETGQTQTTGYAYDTHGDLASVTDPRGHTSTFTYDASGDLLTATDPVGNETSYAYDALGRVTSMVSPRGNVPGGSPSQYTTSYSYDAAGDLTSETDPRGDTTAYGYDAAGNQTSMTDPDGNATTFTYDADNELTKVTRADGSTEISSYDADGNLTGQTNAAGHATTYAYNALSQLTTETDPLNRSTSYGYDADGNLATVTDPTLRVTTYGYDDGERLTSIHYSNGTTPNVSYGYNADGQRTSMTDGTGSSSYSYDSLGRLTSTTDGSGNTVTYSYDLADNTTALGYPGAHTVSRSFDSDNRLSSVTDWLGNQTSFAYDEDSNLISTTFPAGTGETDTYAYTRAEQLSGVTMAAGTTTLASTTDTLDANGQTTSTTQTGLPGPATTTYGYSRLNQLTTAGSNSYAYDAANNATTLDGNSGYSYDAAGELAQAPASADPANGTPTDYSYNALGQRTSATPESASSTNYTYNQAGELTSVTPGGSYAYNGDGLRASKTVGATTATFVWDDTAAILSDGTNSYIYGPDGLPTEFIDHSGIPYYLHHDRLGSTRMLTDSSGAATATWSYNPYGAVNGQTGGQSPTVGYAGAYTDSETDLIYLRARYYDPTTAQFITRDPLEAQTGAPYTYAADNPTNATDPTGLATVGPGLPGLETLPEGPATTPWPTDPIPPSTLPGIVTDPIPPTLPTGTAYPEQPAPTPGRTETIPEQCPFSSITAADGGGTFGAGGGGPKRSPKWQPPTNPPQMPPSDVPAGWRVRVMPPAPGYPNGYWRLEKPMQQGGWQGIDPSTMKPGSQPETHVPLPEGEA